MEETEAKPRKFNVGDVVQIISGGPRMTIVDLNPLATIYRCKWFPLKGDGGWGELQDAWFNEASLQGLAK